LSSHFRSRVPECCHACINSHRFSLGSFHHQHQQKT
jgi:hypothetical protein